MGALPPYPPKVFFSTLYIERYTHITFNHKKQLLQLGKNISPTRKIEKHTPANIANHANPANIGLGTEKVRSWYGEDLGSSPFVLFCSNHHFSLFYFVLFCSIPFELLNLCKSLMIVWLYPNFYIPLQQK